MFESMPTFQADKYTVKSSDNTPHFLFQAYSPLALEEATVVKVE